jgi:UDP-N-acetylmuramate dehydrogenase
MTELAEHLKAAFPTIEFQANFPLAPRTYFKIGGPAEVFATITDKHELARVVAHCHKQHIKLTMLGGGSNVVVSDAGVAGLVCTFAGAAVSELSAADRNLQASAATQTTADSAAQVTAPDQRLLQAEVGIKTSLLVAESVKRGLTGLEYFLGVPGTLGGAIYNNAHYLNDLIGEHVTRVEVIDETGTLQWLPHSACAFGYDSSRFHHTNEVLVTAEFSLSPGTLETSQERIKAATQYRANTQPLGKASSGCIFQNTPNTPALQKLFPQFADKPFVPGGFLIDQAGLKGMRVGDIEVSEKHAAWLINHGAGTQKEVRTAIEQIKTTVRDKFGVELQEEVFYLA